MVEAFLHGFGWTCGAGIGVLCSVIFFKGMMH